MNGFQKRVLWRVLGVHAFAIALLIFVPMIRSCAKPKKPKEIDIFIQTVAAPPAATASPVASMSDPTPAVETPPTVQDPVPTTPAIKEPPKVMERKEVKPPKPKDPPKEKPKPEKPKPDKPKWKPVSPDQIKIGEEVKPARPDPPAISSSKINELFKKMNPSSSPVRSASPGQFNAYYASVMRKLLSAWKPPSSVSSVSVPAEVKISIRKNGSITKRALMKSSGNPLFDRTVMDAARSITMLPRPPADYPFDYVIVPFAMPD